MIHSIIRRKLAILTQQNNQIRYNKFSNFDYQKEKEIAVWVRLQKGLDKNQVIEYIKDNFKASELDASRMFYIAHPDGLATEDYKLIEQINSYCILLPLQEVNILLDDCCQVLMKNKSIEELPQYKVNLPDILDNLEILLKNRNLI